MAAMRAQFAVLALAALPSLLLADGVRGAEADHTVYNRIVLPREWPPHLPDFPTSVYNAPVVPPYLTPQPAVIPIDIGRQLFLDDLLIADTTLTRTFHLAT